MLHKIYFTLFILCLTVVTSCSQNEKIVEKNIIENPAKKASRSSQEQHNYGGWYCPDNLNGFPAVDINNWKNVPVVNDRMPTREETQNGTSLIFVDDKKYPDAKPLDIKMPQLARFYNASSKKDEIVIIIQALNVSNDSVVGFRYLNGGNGSAYLDEVQLLSDDEIESIPSSHFVSLHLDINAGKSQIWNVLTKMEYNKALQSIFNKETKVDDSWVKQSEVNFEYPLSGRITSKFAGNLYGNQYIQIDYEAHDNFVEVDHTSAIDQYVEKFLIVENPETKKSELIIVCGPYGDDFKSQKQILNNWAQKVKELSEQE